MAEEATAADNENIAQGLLGLGGNWCHCACINGNWEEVRIEFEVRGSKRIWVVSLRFAPTTPRHPKQVGTASSAALGIGSAASGSLRV